MLQRPNSFFSRVNSILKLNTVLNFIYSARVSMHSLTDLQRHKHASEKESLSLSQAGIPEQDSVTVLLTILLDWPGWLQFLIRRLQWCVLEEPRTWLIRPTALARWWPSRRWLSSSKRWGQHVTSADLRSKVRHEITWTPGQLSDFHSGKLNFLYFLN